MKESAKQGIFQAFSFTGLCVVMCGAAIGFLISSGWLLIFADEGQTKIFLLPALLIGLLYFLFSQKYKHQIKNFKYHIIFNYIGILVGDFYALYIYSLGGCRIITGGPLLP